MSIGESRCHRLGPRFARVLWEAGMGSRKLSSVLGVTCDGEEEEKDQREGDGSSSLLPRPVGMGGPRTGTPSIQRGGTG